MEQRNTTLRQAGRAALYAVFKRRHARTRRLFVAFESLSFTLVILLSVILQTYLQIKPPTYALDPAAKSLVGESRDDTATYLKDDARAKTFSFSVPKSGEGSNDASVHTGRVADAYEASLAKDAREGISVTEKESQIDVGLTPTFKTYEGRKVEGDHIVYLASGGIKLVYTLKYNGLKEDIIVPSYRGDKLEYGFELSLPAGTEARLDGSGNIGIYSSDPTLFGEISFGSDDDRARVEKARENGEKNHLVMTIPYPIIKDASGQEYTDKASFKLGDREQRQSQAAADPKLPAEVQAKMKASTTKNVYALTIASQGLKGLSYPISIDPTITVTSASDFGGLNNEGGVEVDTTNNLIRRSGLTGGALNAWTTDTTTLPVAGSSSALIAYEGRVYFLRASTTIRYATINANGSIGSFTDTGVTTFGSRHLIYNGYIYTIYSNAWQYAKISPNGSVGQFVATTMHANNGGEYAINAHNGYMYQSGGGTTNGCPLTCNYTNSNAIQYAQIYADGSLSTWASAGSNFTSARRLHQMPIYNGYIYILGGWQGEAGTEQATTNYAKIQSNGTISSWSTTTATSGIGANTGAVYLPLAGYMYKAGGFDADAVAAYAQINTDGTLGSWKTTASLNTSGRGGSGWTTYAGRIYVVGGASNSGANQYNDIQYTTPKLAGELHDGTWSSGTNMQGLSYGHITLVYNGFIYNILGIRDGFYVNTLSYATINTNGSIGAWSTQTIIDNTINNARNYHTAVAYNGYMYIFGGQDGFNSHAPTAKSIYAPINTNGTMGTWNTTTALPTARDNHTTLAQNGYMYLIGGFDTARIGTVHYATINANGTLGAWTATSSLPYGNYGHESVIVGKYIYLIGGSHASATVNDDVLLAEINTNGTLGSWTETTNLPDARWLHTVDTYNGYIYVSGGGNQTPSYVNTVFYAPVNSDGTITSWATTLNLGSNRGSHSSTIYNGYMYITGGSNGTAYVNNVEYQTVNNGGTGNVSSWTLNAANGAGSRRYHQTVAYNGYLYIMGGCFQADCAVTGAQTGGVQYAQINSNGSVGTWNNTNGFPERDTFGAVALNGYMYVSGGTYRTGIFNTLTSRTDLLYAVINSDGTLGAFANTISASASALITDNVGTLYATFGGTTLSFAKPLPNGTIGGWFVASHQLNVGTYHGAFVVANNLLFRIAGCTSGQSCDATNTRRDVEYAPVDPTTGNTAGAFRFTHSLHSRRYTTSNKAYVLNGYIVLPPDGGPVDGDLYYAPILTTGGIGAWTKGTPMGVVRAASSAAIEGGKIYVNGGGAPNNDTYYATILSTPRKGSFSRRYDFDTGVKPTKLITRGTKRFRAKTTLSYSNNLTCNNTAYENSQSLQDITYGAANAQTINLGTSRTLARCLLVKYGFDDMESAIYPDKNTETGISDFDLYFIANPGQRLRGGRTFTNGADRGLDAQPQ